MPVSADLHPRMRAFTLFELLVVMAILAVIVAIVAPNLIGKADDANIQAARVQLEQVSGAIDLYRLETGSYPPDLQALLEPPPGLERWNGPYLRKRSLLTDPWRQPLGYRQPGEHGAFDVLSYGADGQPGGTGSSADIGNWE